MIHTTGNSPMITLYEPAGPNDPPELIALRNAFQSDYTSRFIQQLTAVDATGWQNTITDTVFFFTLGVNFDDKYSGFESSQQGIRDRAENFIDSQFSQKIQAGLDGLGLPWRLTSSQLLGRADAQTCGGCHRDLVSNNVAPASKAKNFIAWPATLPFIHIDEQGQMSDLLVNRFLPARFANLNSFVTHPPARSGRVPSLTQEAAGIRAAIDRLAGPRSDRNGTLQIDKAIEKARQEDRHLPGYFVKVRPPD